MPALIAGSVNLLAFSGALAQAGIVGRFDADRGILVIEPANAREHDAADARIGIAWWNGLTPTRRRYWLDVAGSARPADAWRAGAGAVGASAEPHESAPKGAFSSVTRVRPPPFAIGLLCPPLAYSSAP